jgi:hypothetical protein
MKLLLFLNCTFANLERAPGFGKGERRIAGQ